MSLAPPSEKRSSESDLADPALSAGEGFPLTSGATIPPSNLPESLDGQISPYNVANVCKQLQESENLMRELKQVHAQLLRNIDIRGGSHAKQEDLTGGLQHQTTHDGLQGLQEQISVLQSEKEDLVAANLLLTAELTEARKQTENLQQRLSNVEKTARLAMQENRRVADVVRRVKKDNHELRLVADLRKKMSPAQEPGLLRQALSNDTTLMQGRTDAFQLSAFSRFAQSSMDDFKFRLPSLYTTDTRTYNSLHRGSSIQCIAENNTLHSTSSIQCIGEMPSLTPSVGISTFRPAPSLDFVEGLRPAASLEMLGGDRSKGNLLF